MLRKVSKRKYLLVTCFVVASLGVYPFFSPSLFVLHVLILSNIFVIFAVSFDIFCGYIGELNFGPALFVGTGAYTSAILSTRLGVPLLFCPLVGGVFAVVISLIISLPVLRLGGAAFCLATIAFAEIAELFASKSYSITNGDDGMIVPLLYPSMLGMYYIALMCMVITVVILYAIANSNLGLTFKAIRDDQPAAEAGGINSTKYKIIAFALSAFFAGIGGSLYAHYQTVAVPSMFGLTLSTNIFSMWVVGGQGTILGPIFGAYLLTVTFEYLQPLLEWRYVIYAFIMIFTVLFKPQGMWPTIQKWLKQLVRD